jgi:hypothetical protein
MRAMDILANFIATVAALSPTTNIDLAIALGRRSNF